MYDKRMYDKIMYDKRMLESVHKCMQGCMLESMNGCMNGRMYVNPYGVTRVQALCFTESEQVGVKFNKVWMFSKIKAFRIDVF